MQRSFAFVVYLIISLLLSACTPTVPTHTDAYIDGDEIYYIGEMDADRNQRLFALYDAARTKPSTLTITSPGGSVEHGMALGEWVFQYGLKLRVPKQCASSCANYVFTAARSVSLAPDALIFWHGSPIYDDMVEGTVRGQTRWESVRRSLERKGMASEDTESYWLNIRKRNREFFKTVGVSPLITVALNLADGRSASNSANFSNHRRWAYYLSIEDMAVFGRGDVTVLNGSHWNPTLNPGFKDGIVKLDLATDVAERMSAISQGIEDRNL